LRALTPFGLLLLAGCMRAHAADADRSETLRRALLEHDRQALARDPDLVAAKYARMARTKFAFFRGTAWLRPPEPSRFATPAASQVAVIGDPHPENVGTYLAGGVRAIDFNDFDLAGYGSFVQDLRRLAVGLWVIADMADLKHKQRVRLVEDMVAGYLAELDGLAQGKPPLALRADTLSGNLEEVLAPPDSEARELPASKEDQALAAAVLAAYPKTLVGGAPPPEQLRLKSLARRHAGISSFAVLRLQAVVEGPTPAPGDDWTLELKESGGPAAQIVSIQRQFQERPDLDPLLGWAAVGGREFRVRQVLPGQRRLDAERLAKQVKSPAWAKRDLKNLGYALGRLLARGHAQARARDGKPGLAAIRAATANGDELRAETVAFAEKQALLNTDDFHRFQQLLSSRGPLLGWTK
jgi:uncharacterized protein (DUF2252 family)